MEYISKQSLEDMINLDRVNDRHYDKMRAIVAMCGRSIAEYDFRLDIDSTEWLFDNKEYFDYIFWRWEFLRRNNFYRLTWLYYTSITTPSYWENNSTKSDNFDRFVTDVFGLKKICDPRFDFDQLDILSDGKSYKYFGLDEDIIHNWPEFSDQNSAEIVIHNVEFAENLATANSNVVYIPIDLSLSINQQISKVKPHLKLLQERRKETYSKRRGKPLSKRNAEYWPIYAKILDAHDMGWTHKEIVELLASRKREFAEGAGRDAWVAADRVRRDFRSVT